MATKPAYHRTGRRLKNDEQVFELVQAQLLIRPHSVGDLSVELDIDFPLVSVAIDILKAADAIATFREARQGQRVTVFGIKSQARTWIICEYCNGTGEQVDQRRCQHCDGGLYTPNFGIEYYQSNG